MRIAITTKRIRHQRVHVEDRLKALAKLRIKVGIQGTDALIERGTDRNPINMATLMAQHEFVIGPRPTLRPSLNENKPHIKSKLRLMANAALSDSGPTPIATKLAEHLGKEARTYLFRLQHPPLSDAYRRQRERKSADGEANPLVDTKKMMDAITGKVTGD